MDQMISHCGLICGDCNAYKATVNGDEALRKQTAEEWSRIFGADIKAEDINCLGCKTGINFGYCKVCEVRACSMGRELNNCAGCDSFSCGKLDEIFKFSPEARERLEKLRG